MTERRVVGRVQLRPVGVIRSDIKRRADAPKQGSEGAPDVWLDVHPWAIEALHGILPGDELIVITWFHQARRNVFQVHPRSEKRNPLTGVFATRSPDRPNPLGLHPVETAIDGNRLRVGPSRRLTAFGGGHQARPVVRTARRCSTATFARQVMTAASAR
jgi:tRNA-Thr(GGU) m(6)t(6)A37 methyltransferase TsaA